MTSFGAIGGQAWCRRIFRNRLNYIPVFEKFSIRLSENVYNGIPKCVRRRLGMKVKPDQIAQRCGAPYFNRCKWVPFQPGGDGLQYCIWQLQRVLNIGIGKTLMFGCFKP